MSIRDRAGTVQGMRGGQFDFSPRLLMFTLPFLTNTRAQVTALLQSDLAQKVCCLLYTSRCV